MHKFFLAFLFFSSFSAFAQKKNFDRQKLIGGTPPEDYLKPLPTARWLQANGLLLVSQEGGKITAQVLDPQTGKSTAPPASQGNSPLAVTRVETRDHDLFLRTPSGNRRLTNDTLVEKNATFSPDSNFIAYTKHNDLYTYNLKTGKETRLTSDGSSTILNGYATWLYWEEIFGRHTHFRAFWWSPDSRQLAFMRFDEGRTPMFPLYNAAGQHGSIEETRYPKSGDPNPIARLGFVTPEGGPVRWADFPESDDQYLGWPKWLEDGSGLMVQWINRGNDLLRLYRVSPHDGSKKLVYEESQKTWINIDEADNRLTLLGKSNEMLITSDQSGWKHLYLYTLDGKFKNQVTSGKFTVTSVVGIDARNRVLYFMARGLENTARTDLYRIGLDGKKLKRLTSGPYHHTGVLPSPDYRYFVTTGSNVTTPPRMLLIDNEGKVLRSLGDSEGPAFKEYTPATTELLRVKSEDGLYELPMVITYPEGMKEGVRYPVLISIYGGPDAGTVFDQWNWTPTRQFYAGEGLIQVAFDHRGSGHFGKEGLNYLHRNLGYWEMQDYKTMARYLIDRGIADPGRICIGGFSYGGYLSAYALTYAGDVFTHGMAGGSVTDWKLYDSAYTERFMDTPEENPGGYQSSSVLTHVAKYRGVLQIVHGTMDDNVHLQNTLQLAGELQKAGKDFELMLYPGGRHGWGGAQGGHYSNLKTEFVYRHLLKRAVPEGLLK